MRLEQPARVADLAHFACSARGIPAALVDSMSIQTIESSRLETVVGGKSAATPTKSPDFSQIGSSALSGCLTGAAGSLGKSPQQAAAACALGAGKSLLQSLGKAFGGAKAGS
jgi:hypothetical protein